MEKISILSKNPPEVASRGELVAKWKELLSSELTQPHMLKLKDFLLEEKRRGATVFPKNTEIFRSLHLTPFEEVKVVILGQDPYHGPGQAHGLCFSVPGGVPLPPSLVNIFKELESDVGGPIPKTGDLTAWAQQGVLLLNATLTVEGGKAGSHQNRGWETFTDKIISVLNDQREHLVFILWGSFAQRKGQYIDRKRHHVISSVHPSPLSVYRGFFGHRPFTRANEYLGRNGIQPIQWTP